MQFRKTDITIDQSHASDSLQLAPSGLSVVSIQSGALANATATRDYLHVFHFADDPDGSPPEINESTSNNLDGTITERVGAEFSKISERPFGLIETDMMDDAEVAVVIIGSASGNARHVAREMRAEGVKAGVVKVREDLALVQTLDGFPPVAFP